MNVTNSGFVPIRDSNIHNAADLWINDRKQYDKMYGGLHIGLWDTSSITDMSSLFYNKPNFTDDISSWDTSNVLKMNEMFLGCESFNQSLSNWDVSNVFTFDSMFYGADSFNSDISGWDTSSAVNMASMFENTKSFNQDLSDWDISNLEQCQRMFYNAEAFEQKLCWELKMDIEFSEMLCGSKGKFSYECTSAFLIQTHFCPDHPSDAPFSTSAFGSTLAFILTVISTLGMLYN